MQPGSTFAPLAHRMFALLMAGVLLANLGNAIQSVGASWQLTADGEPADVIALVQTALNLPILLLALPAGAWADLYSRKRIVISAQLFMLVLSLLLAGLALSGNTPAWAIISLTALLACGIASFSPAIGASIRSTVPIKELAAAVAINILIFNTARAVGPAIGGTIVAGGGASAAFIANAACYAIAIALFLCWKPAPEPARTSRPLLAMVVEGLSHAWHSREIRTILSRALCFTFAGAAAWALMPLVAADMLDEGPAVYGLLLGGLGLGAVIGAASATWFRQRFSAEAITRTAGLIYGLALVVIANEPGLELTLVLLVLGGAGWVQALSGFAVAAQLWAPQHVVGRIVALASAVTFGGIAAGAWMWGHYAEGYGVANALLASGGAMIALPLLGLLLPMPEHAAPERG